MPLNEVEKRPRLWMKLFPYVSVFLSLFTLGSLAAEVPATTLIAAGGNSPGFDMAPETRLEVVQAAVAAIPTPLPSGPFQPTWESLQQNYRVPAWFYEAKFGLFMHWG